MKKCLFAAFAAALVLVGLLFAQRERTAAQPGSSVWVYGESGNAASRIVPAGEADPLLCLPATVDPCSLPIYFDLQGSTGAVLSGAAGSQTVSSGSTVDLTALCGAEAPWTLTLSAGECSCTVQFCQAQGLAAMYLTSDDPEQQGRQWVEGCAEHENAAQGTLYMADAQGNAVYSGALTQIRGRGNSTWTAEKKPYQIKLAHKADLLQSGEQSNSRKTWVLLANAFDPSLLRNALVYDLAGAMGMESFMESRQVCLYYDGEFLGVYQLCEKVGINPGRVEIHDLEEDNQAVNSEPLSSLPMASGATESGAVYHYRAGMTDPADITGGYLLEMEFSDRVSGEDCYFVTSRGSAVVVKSPEYCSEAQMAYISALYQSYEDAAYSGGTDPRTGKTLGQLMDMTSLARYYLISEWTKNPDGFSTSCYIYKDAGDSTLVMGPVWDFDLALGLGHTSTPEQCRQPEGWFTACFGLPQQLIRCGEFRSAVCRVFEDTMLPLLRSVVVSEEAAPVKSLRDRAAELSSAALCNALRWGDPGGANWTEGVSALGTFIARRTAWLEEALSQWQVDETPEIPQFLDVPSSAWYCAYIEAAADSGFMRGYVYGSFAPEESITRAQAVAVLYSACGSQSAERTAFSDVSEGDWYAPALAWAKERGIAAGKPDGSFRPGDGLTRREAAILLYRLAEGTCPAADVLSAFADGDSITGAGRDALSWAVSAGVLTGYPDGTLRPERITTRGEFAAMLMRALAAS